MKTWYSILNIPPRKVVYILNLLSKGGVMSENIKITYAMDTEEHIFYFHENELTQIKEKLK